MERVLTELQKKLSVCRKQGNTMIIKNENSIYIFFQMIEQIKPQSVLDMGMFLKRVGSVSRKIMGCEVPAFVQLDGIDFFPEVSFPIWNRIYNQILPADRYFETEQEKRYDLAIVLGAEELQKKRCLQEIIKRAALSHYVLTDKMASEWNAQDKLVRVTDMTVEEDTYFLLEFGA